MRVMASDLSFGAYADRTGSAVTGSTSAVTCTPEAAIVSA
jgi:hypothetical protein